MMRMRGFMRLPRYFSFKAISFRIGRHYATRHFRRVRTVIVLKSPDDPKTHLDKMIDPVHKIIRLISDYIDRDYENLV